METLFDEQGEVIISVITGCIFISIAILIVSVVADVQMAKLQDCYEKEVWMGTLLEEHGDALKCSLISFLVVAFMIIGINIADDIMPIFSAGQYYRNADRAEAFIKYSPSIEADYAVYAEKNRAFNLFEYVRVVDYDGTDISDRAVVDGQVNLLMEGLQYVVVTVTNDKGFTVSKRINILVE